MITPAPFPGEFPHRVASPSGLNLEFNANGSLRRLDHAGRMLNLFPGNEMDGGPANIHLRVHGESMAAIPLVGPGSPAAYRFDDDGLWACGQLGGVLFRLRVMTSRSAAAWFWHVEIENTGAEKVECDLIHTQDAGLADPGAIRLNEYYVSQYVDHTPIHHARHGWLVASRQNQAMGGMFPWMLTGAIGGAVSHATDALQFHGLAARLNQAPVALATGLPGQRWQHEHSMVCLQSRRMCIAPGETARDGFFAMVVPDKPTATTDEDAAMADVVLALPEARPPVWPGAFHGLRPATSLFSSAPVLAGDPLDEATLTRHFGTDRRHPESSPNGILSFFSASGSHVVLAAKELAVLRPHGHLLRTGGALVPDECALTSTAWMGGVFHSMVTQGHVSINRFLSTCHTYLGLFRSHGQRAFIEMEGTWHLLGLPSAFEMGMDFCRWIYRHPRGLIEVTARAPDDAHHLHLSLAVLEGPPARFLVSHHVALNGDDGNQPGPALWEWDADGIFTRAIPDSDVGRRFPGGGFHIAPTGGTTFATAGGDELLFTDGQSRRQPFLCVITAASRAAGLRIEGRLVAPEAGMETDFWKKVGAGLRVDPPAASPMAGAVDRAAEIFPWFVQNALVHYLSPRGLEQYSGGGWGTRDVCQGPVELLLALGRFNPIRDLLTRVFRQQNPDGDWPQWFMFFDRERGIRPGDSHGDIVYWPLLALAQYLLATGDAPLLDESLPFFHPDVDAADHGTVWEHAGRALDLIQSRVIAGTCLAAYGHGDWNDSLQPAKPDMRDHLCSAWTVTLNHQTFVTLARALRSCGREADAMALEARADAILAEFQQVLIADGVLAGLAYFHPDGKIDHLLHPRDQSTGLSYSLLAMIHAIINGLFTPGQAETHLAVIRKHLTGPDGARLFDRPMDYHGGLQRNFQRAESASFFGREIGIMYTHAHLRYCEALAFYGDAGGFFHALGQINPIGLGELVPAAMTRQSNCYYSSSDGVFADRYAASRDYGKLLRGEIPLEGGWRVYSSGAGIGARLIMQCFLGLRLEADALLIDPVIPRELDGLKAEVVLGDWRIAVTYHVASAGCGPSAIRNHGRELPFTREPNPYRPGAARIPLASLASSPDAAPRPSLDLVVWLG